VGGGERRIYSIVCLKSCTGLVEKEDVSPREGGCVKRKTDPAPCRKKGKRKLCGQKVANTLGGGGAATEEGGRNLDNHSGGREKRFSTRTKFLMEKKGDEVSILQRLKRIHHYQFMKGEF